MTPAGRRVRASDRRAFRPSTKACRAPSRERPCDSRLTTHESRPCFLMHVPRERLHVFDGNGRQDAVTEVEDVPGPSRRAREDVVGGGEDTVERAEQQRRVEIALDAAIEPDLLPRLV